MSKTIKSYVGPFLLPYLFILSGLMINCLQFLTLFVWPFDQLLYRKLNYYLTYLFYANFTAVIRWWSGTNCEVYMNQNDLKYFGNENTVIVMNHKYDTDWLLGLSICQRVGILGGTKIVAKSVIKLFPIFGWNLLFGENIFLKRNWEQDFQTITKKFKSILNFPKDYFFNIIILCEGTRFTEEKHRISLEFAKTRGLPQLKHHLLPRTKGFYTLMDLGKGKIEAIINCTLVIKDSGNITPNIMTLLRGEPMQTQMIIERIPIKDVPIDNEKKCAEFVYKIFEEKDKIFDKYVETGTLESIGIKRLPHEGTKYDLYLAVFWALLIIPASVYYLLQALIFGSITVRFIIMGVILLLYVLSKRLLRETMIKSSSSFGLKEKKSQKKD